MSLVAQFDSGVCENLLENTAFNDINDMDAWQIRNGSVVERALDNINGFKIAPGPLEWTDALQQRIYRSRVITKLQPSTWYTLSFYAYASLIYPIYNLSTPAYNSSSPYYGIGSQSSIYMESGQTITVSVTGYVASAAVKVRYYAWRQNSDGSWAQSSVAEFTSTSATTKTFTFTNTSGSAAQIYFRGYVYLATGSQNSSSATQNRGYISNVVIYRGAKLDTYLYRSDNGDAIVHDSAHPWIVNGVSVSSAKQMDDAITTFPQMTGSYVYFSGDGHVRWQMTTGWKRYSVTFFTSSSLVDDVEYRILFRLQGTGHETVIAKPKLERNTMPTEWIEHTNDRMAADFQHIYAGEWASGTAYMYANGVRHVVRAKKSASGEKTFFRLKKRTSSTGYVSTSEPYSDTTYWEEASYLKFVATDLMLADEVITDKLTVSKIRGAGGKFILDKDGNVTAVGGTYNNISAIGGTFRNVLVNGVINVTPLIIDETNFSDYFDSEENITSIVYNINIAKHAYNIHLKQVPLISGKEWNSTARIYCYLPFTSQCAYTEGSDKVTSVSHLGTTITISVDSSCRASFSYTTGSYSSSVSPGTYKCLTLKVISGKITWDTLYSGSLSAAFGD